MKVTVVGPFWALSAALTAIALVTRNDADHPHGGRACPQRQRAGHERHRQRPGLPAAGRTRRHHDVGGHAPQHHRRAVLHRGRHVPALREWRVHRRKLEAAQRSDRAAHLRADQAAVRLLWARAVQAVVQGSGLQLQRPPRLHVAAVHELAAATANIAFPTTAKSIATAKSSSIATVAVTAPTATTSIHSAASTAFPANAAYRMWKTGSWQWV